MTPLTRGKYTVRPVSGSHELEDVFALRTLCFGAVGGTSDGFDRAAQQIAVYLTDTNEVVAAFRMSVLQPCGLPQSYAAQYYDLSALMQFDGPLLELGRFCVHPECSDPDILRLAWAGLTAHVDRTGVKMLFGCSSFEGTDPAPYRDAFALLNARHLGPARWQVGGKAPEVYDYAADLPNLARAQAGMPALLRTYLLMGGWVSDHAVIDRAMGTLHVFTGLEIDAIPPARKRLLRALV